MALKINLFLTACSKRNVDLIETKTRLTPNKQKR